jgi:GNAT superfamily N-acetyltransferase
MAYQVEMLELARHEDVAGCFRVFSVLRPHLDEGQFIARLQAQVKEGYQIAYVKVDGEVGAAAGYRVAHFLAWGKVLYVDDLVTHPEQRNRGLGGVLMDWLLEQAKKLCCDEVHLDTGFQRHGAHRLYLNKGFVLSCHHMSTKVT